MKQTNYLNALREIQQENAMNKHISCLWPRKRMIAFDVIKVIAVILFIAAWMSLGD